MNSFDKMNKFLKSVLWISLFGFTILFLFFYINTYLAETKKQQLLSQNKLQAIAHSVENSLQNAQEITRQIASMVENIISTEDETALAALEQFLYHDIDKLGIIKDESYMAAYAASPEWMLLRGFTPPDDYVATERTWYKGAKTLAGKIYITETYIDARTGLMCFTMSKILKDKKTVVGVDFSLKIVQDYVEEMGQEDRDIAFIVNEKGVIIGSSIQDLIGQNYNSLKEYNLLIENVYKFYGQFFKHTLNDKQHTVFSEKTKFGWYLIVCSVNNDLFFNEYKKLSIMLGLYFLFLFGLVAYIIIKNLTHIKAFFRVLFCNSTQSNLDGYSRESKNTTFKIIAILSVTVFITIGVNIYSQQKLINESIEQDITNYQQLVSKWFVERKAILNLLGDTISITPNFTDDYEFAVKYLNKIVQNYDGISAAYIANPELAHSVIMNSGWKPSEDWRVEERPWYIQTVTNANELSISSPYKDEQSGMYCITISKQLFDEQNNFIGVLGMDFYIDKLMAILDDSYTPNSYAFLVDQSFHIINHPYDFYRLNNFQEISANNLSYRDALIRKEITLFKDYDGEYKVALSKYGEVSGFTIVLVKRLFSLYSALIFYNSIIVAIFLLCVFIVIKFMKKLKKWQRIINQELEDAAIKAVAAKEAKSDFLANMSHEIRTPINAILGMNEMILRESKDTQIKEYSANISNAGNALLSIINDILDFSKIESCNMEVVEVEYSVVEVIDQLTMMVKQRAEDKNLEFILKIDPTLPKTLKGDDIRLKQIVTNILTNAVKYTKTGSVTLSVSYIESFEKNQKIYGEFEILVEDTGLGIKQEDMPNLFAPFKRVDLKKNRTVEGTGLGISIVQKLLNMMGSTLEVESEYGVGSKFFFTIVQEVVNCEAIGDFEQCVKAQKFINQESKKSFIAPNAKLLVVDDNQMNLEVIKNLLKRVECKTTLCVSGFEAIEELKNGEFDLVFLDHMMPELDGIETLQKINELQIAKNTAFVSLTANALSGAKQFYISHGFNDYLSKPIVVEDLEKMIQKWLKPELVEFTNATTNEMADLRFATCREFDEAIALQYSAGSHEILAQNISFFLQNNKAVLEQLSQDDLSSFQRAAHSLKSSSATIGAIKLSNICKEAEHSDEALSMRETILERYNALIDELKSLHVEVQKNELSLEQLYEELLSATKDFDTVRMDEIYAQLKPSDDNGKLGEILQNFDEIGLEEFIKQKVEK